MDSSGAHGAKIRFSTQFYVQRSPRDHGPGCHASSSQALPMMASLMPPELGIDDTLLPRWQLHIYITMVSWFLHLLLFVILYIYQEQMTHSHGDDSCSSNSLQKRPKMPSTPPRFISTVTCSLPHPVRRYPSHPISRKAPQCYILCGWFLGALAALYLPSTDCNGQLLSGTVGKTIRGLRA